jgi:hypothetical protein
MYGDGEGTSYSDKDKDEWVQQGVDEYIDSNLDNLYTQAYEQAADNFDFPYYIKEEDVTDADGNKTSEVHGIRAACKIMKTRYSKPFESVQVEIPQPFPLHKTLGYGMPLHHKISQ